MYYPPLQSVKNLDSLVFVSSFHFVLRCFIIRYLGAFLHPGEDQEMLSVKETHTASPAADFCCQTFLVWTGIDVKLYVVNV